MIVRIMSVGINKYKSSPISFSDSLSLAPFVHKNLILTLSLHRFNETPGLLKDEGDRDCPFTLNTRKMESSWANVKSEKPV